MPRPAALVLILLTAPWLRGAESLADSAHVFAKRVVAALTPGETCEMAVRSASSLSPADVALVRRALTNEAHCGASNGAVKIAVTLSDNTEGLVWVAEIVRNGARQAVLIEHPSGVAAAAPSLLPATIRKQLLFPESEGPVLDAAVSENTGVVLEPGGVAFYTRPDRGTGWSVSKKVPISVARPWPRDLRGRILLDGDTVRVLLPGVGCTGQVRPEPALRCNESDQPWPDLPEGSTLAADRNVFNARGLPAFFSAAKTGADWLLATADGRARRFTSSFAPGSAFPGWGSEIAAISGSCGRGFQVLATRPGDWDEADTVQAFEIADGQAEPVSVPLEFPGPVTALWTAANQTTVTAVSRDLRTGHYAIYSLATYCSR